MSKFRVGQLIKKVRGDGNIGITGTVVDTNCTTARDKTLTLTVRLRDSAVVIVPSNNTTKVATPGTRINTAPNEWEPVTDSYDVVSWESCEWKPDHLKENHK